MFYNKWFVLFCYFKIIYAVDFPFFMDFETCRSDVCYEDALNLLSSINKSIDPCTDFYEFACGAWVRNNARPVDEASWSQWEPVIREVDQKLQQILENRTPENYQNNGIQIARKFYQTCLKIDEESENLREILNVIDSFVVWPILSPNPSKHDFSFQVITKINSNLNIFPLLKFHVSFNLYNTTESILYIDYPNLSFPKIMLKNPQLYSNQLDSYKTLIKHSIQQIAFNENLQINNIDSQVQGIINFETKLAQIMDFNRVEDISNLYKKMTVAQLQIWTNLITTKTINWVDILNKLFKKNIIKLETNIIVKDLLYVLNLIKLIDKSQPEIINNYIGWTIFNYFSKEISSNFDKIFFETDKILFGVENNFSRKNKCIISISKHMNVAISHEYIKNFVPEENKKHVENMVETIKNILIKKLDEFNWLDDVTKSYALEKARYISNIVAYPDNYLNITLINNYYKGLFVERNNIRNIISWNNFMRKKEFNKLLINNLNEPNWNIIVSDVNAYYNILQNLIIIPSGIIQYPFFHINRLNALNYGAIGTLIAHELSHAFDNTGRQADKHGNIKQWWTEKSLEKYTKNLKCLEEHYDTYMINIIQNLEAATNSSKTILKLSSRTQDENIADIIGVKLAFEAFQKTKQHLKLPGLDFTEEQLFFISFANQWCENTTPENLFLQLIDGDHTPNKLRVIGALSNNEDFAKYFGCPVNSEMNPNKKCDF